MRYKLFFVRLEPHTAQLTSRQYYFTVGFGFDAESPYSLTHQPSPPTSSWGGERHRLLKYIPSRGENVQLTSFPPALDSTSMAKQENVSKSASRVSLDHFNPEGVQELSRTLSRPSAQARVTSVHSDKTLAPDEPFSLEKTLRAALDK